MPLATEEIGPDAADAYRRYLTKWPAHAAVWLRLGNMLKEARQFEQADCAYAEAARLTPRKGVGPRMRGRAQSKARRTYCRHAAIISKLGVEIETSKPAFISRAPNCWRFWLASSRSESALGSVSSAPSKVCVAWP